MKTYSRRNPDLSIINNINELCRLCLKSYENMILLFPDNNDHFIARKVTSCLGYEMIKEENLPNRICFKCYETLESWQKFKAICEVVYHKLELHLKAINCKNRKKQEDKVDYVKQKEKEDISENVIVNSCIEDGSTVLENSDCSNQPSEEQNDETVDTSLADTNFNDQTEAPSDNNQSYDISAHIMEGLVTCGLVQMQDELIQTNIPVEIQLVTADGEIVSLEFEHFSVENEVEPIPGQQEENDNKNATQTERKPTCAQCGKRFSNRSVLERHKKVHSGEKPYKCPLCERSFTQKEVLRRHKLTHNANRPYKCSICPKSFTQKANLLSHERSHWSPSERPVCLHSCPTCGKMFLYPSGLSRHLLSHTGVHFKCDSCNKSFKDRSSLKRHIVKLHQDQDNKQDEDDET